MDLSGLCYGMKNWKGDKGGWVFLITNGQHSLKKLQKMSDKLRTYIKIIFAL